MQGQRYFSAEVLDQVAQLDETTQAEGGHNPLTAPTDREVDVPW